MYFKFEALYWTKLAEEEERGKKPKSNARRHKAVGEGAGRTIAKPQAHPAYDEDPLPV